jgi:peptidoglycan/LPS O-acetylase OafA/YrhL
MRIKSLDSIRGIAAAVVLLHHCWKLEENDHVSLTQSLHSIIGTLAYFVTKVQESGRAAVLIFFVLSGFVLARSLAGKAVPYGQYVVRRFARIYPAFFFSVTVSLLLHLLIAPREMAYTSEWASDISHPPISPFIYIKHLLMLGVGESMQLNGVMWSLVHEMRISLLFPVLLWLGLRFKAGSAVAVGMVRRRSSTSSVEPSSLAPL